MGLVKVAVRNRPVVNLAFHEGVGSTTGSRKTNLQRGGAPVLGSGEVTKDLLAKRFPEALVGGGMP